MQPQQMCLPSSMRARPAVAIGHIGPHLPSRHALLHGRGGNTMRLDVRAYIRGMGRLMSSGGTASRREAERKREKEEQEAGQARMEAREEKHRLRVEAAERREAEAAAAAAAAAAGTGATAVPGELSTTASIHSVSPSSGQPGHDGSSSTLVAGAPAVAVPDGDTSGMSGVLDPSVVAAVGTSGVAEGGEAAGVEAVSAGDVAAAAVTPVEGTAQLQLVEESEMWDDGQEDVEVFSLQATAQRGWTFVTSHRVGQGVLVGVGLLALATLAIAIRRVIDKKNTPRARRTRQVNLNKLLIDDLQKGTKLDFVRLTMLRWKTGFTPVEIFRKYLWYVLRDCTFNQSVVNDLVTLRDALKLKPEDVAEALRERSHRVYEAYGTLMLNTEGMTAAGVQRKATSSALFRKLLYLTEQDVLLPQDSEAARATDLQQIFGATEEDVANIRIVSLTDVDIDKLDADASCNRDDILDHEEEGEAWKNKHSRPPPEPKQ